MCGVVGGHGKLYARSARGVRNIADDLVSALRVTTSIFQMGRDGDSRLRTEWQGGSAVYKQDSGQGTAAKVELHRAVCVGKPWKFLYSCVVSHLV